MITFEQGMYAGGTIGGVAVVGRLVVWMVQRQLKKIVDHVDDQSIHVDPNDDSEEKVTTHMADRAIHLNPGNGYTRQELCDERSQNIEKRLDEQHAALSGVHSRMDKLIEQRRNDTYNILKAISRLEARKEGQ